MDPAPSPEARQCREQITFPAVPDAAADQPQFTSNEPSAVLPAPPKNWLKLAVPLTLLTLFPACYKWSTGGLGQVAADNPRTVRVTTSQFFSGHVLESAVVSGDSLVGVDKETGERVAIHLGDVRRIETQRLDGIRTIALVGGVVFAAGVVAFAASCGGDNIIC